MNSTKAQGHNGIKAIKELESEILYSLIKIYISW
jgi:hypothetical protein